MIRRPPKSTLFPSPTLFRSGHQRRGAGRVGFDLRHPGEHQRGEGEKAAPAGDRVERSGESGGAAEERDRKSTRLNSSHSQNSYAVFCLKKKKNNPLTSNVEH